MGAGLLTVDTVHAPAGAATLNGVGGVVITGQPVGAAALAGSGVIVVSAAELFGAQSAFGGTGAFNANATHTPLGEAHLFGGGRPGTPGGTGNMAGAGGLSAAAILIANAAGLVLGSGTISATAAEIESASAGLSGAGGVIASSAFPAVGAAALSGAGALYPDYILTDESGNPITDESGNFILAGGGITILQAGSSATLPGVGALAAATVLKAVDTAAFAGAGHVSAIVSSFVGTANLSGAGTVAVDSLHVCPANISINGSGALVAFGSAPQLASAAFAGTGAISISEAQIATASASLVGDGELLIFGGAWPASADLVAVAQLVALGSVAALSAAQMTGAGAVIETVALVARASAHFAGSSDLSVGIQAQEETLAGEGTLDAVLNLVALGKIAFAGDGEIGGFGGRVPRFASADFVGDGTLRAYPDKSKFGETDLGGSGLLDPDSDIRHIVYPAKAWFKMARDNYDPMTLVRLKVTFTRLDTGALIDPTEIVLYRQLPDDSEDALSYLDGDITKDSEGKYHYDALLSVAGRWRFKWQGHGAVEAATPDVTVTVNESELVGDLWPARAGFNAAGALAA